MKATSAKARTERRDKETWTDHSVATVCSGQNETGGFDVSETMRNLSTMHTSSPEQGATLLLGIAVLYPWVCVSMV